MTVLVTGATTVEELLWEGIRMAEDELERTGPLETGETTVVEAESCETLALEDDITGALLYEETTGALLEETTTTLLDMEAIDALPETTGTLLEDFATEVLLEEDATGALLGTKELE